MYAGIEVAADRIPLPVDLDGDDAGALKVGMAGFV